MTNVLVVEDDPRVASALTMALKGASYGVTTAADAMTAAVQVRKCQPDICVLDINLPGGDGFVVAERISLLAPGTPLIFITASKKLGLRQRARTVGAAQLLEKPFGVSELIESIEQTLADRLGDANRQQIG